jgi:zinc/manganese transport system substrate-binding protein
MELRGHPAMTGAQDARPGRRKALVCIAAAALLAAVALAGCGGTAEGADAGATGEVHVVAAENFWGSIAAQLAGAKALVKSIINNPAIDPHSYEPTTDDAIALAESRLAIVNGIGYDPWASQLLAANPWRARRVVNVGRLLGLTEGDNPHQWYSPSSVQRVIAQITADLEQLDPKDRAYFEEQRNAFETRGLATYEHLIAEIRSRYQGVPVGYSESIFQPLGQALGLRLLTPASFADAVAEGTDVTAADTETVAEQAQHHQIKVWVYNSQNATPDVQRATALARAVGIPVVTVTETLSPASATFESWQDAQLERLAQALHEATGR